MSESNDTSNQAFEPEPLDSKSLYLRRLVARALIAADKGHVGSAFSLIEVLRVLYESVIKHDPARPTLPSRDRVILSKGHGCLALYAVLADNGYFPLSALDTFCARNSVLGGHPERHVQFGIEASTGALGHGLPLSVGMALANQRKNTGVRIFVVVGDGEFNEGSNWEALLIAAKYQLANLTIVVDSNKQQQAGPISEILPIEPLAAKFESFGAVVTETDGHSLKLLRQAFREISLRRSGPPGVIIAHSIKGKGLNIAEHNPDWHYRRGFSVETRQQMAEALDGLDTRQK